MELVRAEIELINAGDLIMVQRGSMKAGEVRRMTVEALVDRGASMLVIPEHVRWQLGLELIKEEAEDTSGEVTKVPVVGPIGIRFANRRAVADAMVIGNEVLLGVLGMEAMDVIVHPKSQKLVVNPANPTFPKRIVKGVRRPRTGTND